DFSLLDAELAHRLDGDRGYDPLAADIELDVRDRLSPGHALHPARKLVARADLHSLLLRSAADLAHGPRRRAEPRAGHTGVELLAPHGVANQDLDLVVAGARAQGLAQVRLADREEAGAQLAVGGKPDAVAVGAERLRDGIDEADLARPIGEPMDAGSGVRLARHLDELVPRLDDLPNLGAGQDRVRRPGAVRVQRHELDETDLIVGRARELAEAQHLVLGEVPHRNRVHLDRP